MPQQRELNIRLGFLFDEKSLKALESRLQRSGERLSRSGDALAAAFTLPLAGIGVAAIKSAGDMESLTLALQSQLGSAEAAKKEFQALNEAAKSPGLGVEQAVAGSVRLQGVGLAAEDARKVLIQFGNAIARTGGTAENLDGVTKQFAQMISKGKVLQSDVSVIAENMPAVAGLMQQAFGTSNVEAIRDMGVSGKEFVLQLTKAAETLPRVQGGIKNSIGNALDSLKQSAAKLGDTLNRAFDVTGSIEGFAAGLSSVADGFAALPPAVQNVTLGFAAVLAGIGPMLKLFGGVRIATAQLVGVWADAVGGARGFVSAMGTIEGALTRVKLAFGIVGVVVALTAAVYAFTDQFDAAEYASQKFAEAQKEVVNQSAAEIAAVNKNFDALKSETLSRVEKGKVVDALIKQYPEYLRGIDLESASVSQLTKIQKGLNEQILRGVAERQKASAVTALYEKQAQILLRIQQLKEGAAATASESTLVNAGDTGWLPSKEKIASEVAKKLKQQADELGNQITIVSGQFDRAFGTMARSIDPALDAEYKMRDAYYAQRDAMEESRKKVRELSDEEIKAAERKRSAYREVISDIANASAKAKLIGDDADLAKIEALEKGMGRLLDLGFKPASKEVQDLKRQFDALTASFKPIAINTIAPKPVSTAPLQSQSDPTGTALDVLPSADGLSKPIEAAITPGQQLADVLDRLNGGALKFGEAFGKAMQIVSESGSLSQGVILAVGEAVGQAAAQGEVSFAGLAQAAVGAAAKVVRAWIQQGVAAAVAKALSSLPFPINIAAGAVAGGLAAGLFTKAIGAIGVKGFAKGTSYAPGGMALVGETGPELVNLPTGSQVYSNQRTNAMLSDMAASRQVEVVGYLRASGTDLIAVIENADKKLKRQR